MQDYNQADIEKRFAERKAMTTVRFAYVLNSERHYDFIATDKCEKWSDFVCSYKIKQRQRITV